MTPIDVSNIRNRINALRAQSGYHTHVDVGIGQVEELLMFYDASKKAPNTPPLSARASGPLTEHDWLQLEQAAAGCTSGIENWPHLRAAIQKLMQYKPMVITSGPNGEVTQLDASCETMICPDCKGRGMLIGQGGAPCKCHGTGLVLKNPPMPSAVFNAIVDKVVDRLAPDL